MGSPRGEERGALGSLAGRTGRGVRVAILDSGLNPRHRHARGHCARGAGFRVGGRRVQRIEDSFDLIGHGTALAGVVRLWAPEAELVPVRIFEQELACPARVARAALAWALEAGADVVNLSLAGAAHQGWHRLVRRAREQGTVLVAAASNRDGRGFPAVLSGVLGVRASGHPRRFERLQGELAMSAPGNPRALPGPINYQGNSVAAAHVTGLVARVRELRPGADLETVLETLAGLFSAQG